MKKIIFLIFLILIINNLNFILAAADGAIVKPIAPGVDLKCETRDDCLAAGVIEPNDYCDMGNGDVVRPHLSCFQDKCQVLTGTPNKDGAYRVDCNYGGCYNTEEGNPMCCTKDGCKIDGGIGIDIGIGMILLPPKEGPGIIKVGGECETRDDCLAAGIVEPNDYCDPATGDVVRPHLSCFQKKCTILTGIPDDDGPYRVDCKYNQCYNKEDGKPMCCTEDGCKKEGDGPIIGIDPGAGIGIGVGADPGIGLVPPVEGPGIVLPGDCKTRDDCLAAGFSEPNKYCDILNGDVVDPHLSCFKDKCTILIGEVNDDGPYRLDCNYGSCFSDEGKPKCCTKDGCPIIPEDDIIKEEKDKIDKDLEDKAGILPGDFFFFLDKIFEIFKSDDKKDEERAAEVAVLAKEGKNELAKEHLEKYFSNIDFSEDNPNSKNVVKNLERAYDSSLDKDVLKNIIDKEKENKKDIVKPEESLEECSLTGVCCPNNQGCKGTYYKGLICSNEQVCCDSCNEVLSNTISNNDLGDESVGISKSITINTNSQIQSNSANNPVSTTTSTSGTTIPSSTTSTNPSTTTSTQTGSVPSTTTTSTSPSTTTSTQTGSVPSTTTTSTNPSTPTNTNLPPL
ncbi:MAG: hypothetical protein WC867_04640 [Candidatus Pacearchaeota archaeon]|jgi:hypothetical protein